MIWQLYFCLHLETNTVKFKGFIVETDYNTKYTSRLNRLYLLTFICWCLTMCTLYCFFIRRSHTQTEAHKQSRFHMCRYLSLPSLSLYCLPGEELKSSHCWSKVHSRTPVEQMGPYESYETTCLWCLLSWGYETHCEKKRQPSLNNADILIWSAAAFFLIFIFF